MVIYIYLGNLYIYIYILVQVRLNMSICILSRYMLYKFIFVGYVPQKLWIIYDLSIVSLTVMWSILLTNSDMYFIYSQYPFAPIHLRKSYLTHHDKQTQITLPEEFTHYKIIKSKLSSSPLKYTLTLSNNLCIVFGLNIFTRYISDGQHTLDEYDDNSTISQYLKTYTGPYYRVWITGLRHLSNDIPNLYDIYHHLCHNGVCVQSDPPQTVYIVNGQYLENL